MRNKIMRNKKILFTDWALGLSNFKIYDSFKTLNLITERTIDENGYTNWFNIDNIKREIESYAKNNNIKFIGLKETLKNIKDNGFSYTDKTKFEFIKEAEKRYEKGIKIKIIE